MTNKGLPTVGLSVGAEILLCMFLWSLPSGALAQCTDADGDGFCIGTDCDDTNPDCTTDCTDTDLDGVCDNHDNCPTVPNPNQGTVTKLNGPMVAGGAVPFDVFSISPDQSTVVYIADQDTDTVNDLYSVPIAGGNPTKLNGPLVFGGVVFDFSISPNSSTVVYVADQDTDDVRELYSVPISGGASTKLNGPLVAGGDVFASLFSISPDSSTVVYRADQDTDGVRELYSVPISGGTPTKLNGPQVLGGDVLSFSISPDSSTVVYLADQDTDAVNELYSVPISGGTPTKLNGILVFGGDVPDVFSISPNSSRVVYRADQDTDEVFELYSVPIAGGTPTKLNGPLVLGGDVFGGFSISPDSSRVVYRADQDTDQVNELYSVLISGGFRMKLNGPLVFGGDVLPGGFSISPNSSRVVYRADQDTDQVNELYSVLISGGIGGPTKLNGPLVAGGDVFNDFSISPNSSRVVYRADQDTDEVNELYSVLISGGIGGPTKLNGPLVAGGNVLSFSISPNSSRVVYRADQDTDQVFELYSVSLSGGIPTKLNGPLVLGGDVFNDFSISPNSSSVVYRADQDTDQVFELYSVSLIDANGLDGDGDGRGGACDCDDSNANCTTDCTDTDADDVCDAQDNCPTVPNPNQGTPTKLNGPLPGGGLIGGDVFFDFSISPDSARVVYRADQDTDEVFELYSVTISGGAPTKLNGPLVAGGDVLPDGFIISRNGLTVVYRADQDTDNVFELYSVPISGGTATKLNGPLVFLGDVFDFSISPDSARVVYRADQDTNEVFELYSVPIAGGTPTKLNGPLVLGGDVFTSVFLISPDSSRVVYRADQDTDGIIELYSVPVAGGNPTKLNGPLVPGGAVFNDFSISPDSSTVVYPADQDTDDVVELYSVPISGGTSTKLNGPLVFGGDVFQSVFSISPDSSTVVYRADQDTNDAFELYSVPLSGGIPTKLNGPLVFGRDVSFDFSISPDSARVVYRADQDTDEVVELYSVPIAGGTPTKLNGPLVPGGGLGDVDDVFSFSFLISPDSSTVVYHADQDTEFVFELYSVPISGGIPTKLNGPLVAGGGVISSVLFGVFSISPDNSTVVYRANQDTANLVELYSVPISGGTPTKLNGPLVFGGNIDFDFSISPDSSTVLYRADQDTDNVLELYRVPLNPDANGFDHDGDGRGGACDCDDRDPICGADCTDADGDGFCVTSDCLDTNANCTTDCTDTDADGVCDNHDNCSTVPNPNQGTPTKLNGPLVPGGDVFSSFSISPDSSRIVYRADQDTSNVVELYSVPISGGTPTKLNGPLVPGGDVFDFSISPDSSTVVYHADQDTDNVLELYSVPTSGGTPTKLNGPLVLFGGVSFDFSISPDSSRVVYHADQDTDNVLELYSVPTSGGTPTKLNGPLVLFGGVSFDFSISPDSSRVVYRADQDTDDVFELYSVPIAGGTPTKLNGPLVLLGDVFGFSISPNSSRVVYRADQDTDLVNELYSVPISGGIRMKLNGPLVFGGDVFGFSISPNSSRVVYRADQDTDQVDELYSVLISGGIGGPTKLNGPLVVGGGVSNDFSISPESSRVVYRAVQDTVGIIELYSVPISGGTPTKLNGPLVLGGVVFGPFLISPDSSTVVYRADQDTVGIVELYSVPVLGGAPTKLNGPLVLGGVVFEFSISPDSSRVVYRADQDTDVVFELYSVLISGGIGGPTKLNGLLVFGGDIDFDFSISPDSSTVVYRADQDTDNVLELYRVPLTVDANGFDRDADGRGGACDCDNGNGQVWATPDEVRNLLFSSDKQTLGWDPPLDLGGASVLYDTLRSEDPAEFVTGATCVESDDGSDTTAADAAVPLTGIVRSFLIRAENACPSGEGSLGTDSDGVERTGRVCP